MERTNTLMKTCGWILAFLFDIVQSTQGDLDISCLHDQADCMENYGGYACQDCKDENHFGPDCQSVCECQHGICNSGVSGDGSCTCYAGYTGPRCDQELPVCGSVICESTSHCVLKDGQPRCECLPGYKKVGISCQAQDPCRSSQCSSLAVCKTTGPTKYECTCKEGYQGDGRVCQPINPCANNNGGCPENSTICRFLSPGKSMCVCKPGLSGLIPSKGCRALQDCPMHYCDRSSKCEKDTDETIRDKSKLCKSLSGAF